MKRNETFRVLVTCPGHDRPKKPVRVSREGPPGELKEGREQTVNPMLLLSTHFQVFEHVEMCCIGTNITELRGAVSFRSYMNRYF